MPELSVAARYALLMERVAMFWSILRYCCILCFLNLSIMTVPWYTVMKLISRR